MNRENSAPPPTRPDRAGLLHLLIVYLVWGSTYLAIRVAVREGAGFPPFTMAAMRVLVAATVLLGWAFASGQRLRLARGELILLAGTGLLFWSLANGLVTWSEQRAESGLAALLVATMPLWTAAFESCLDRRRPTVILTISLLAGFAGVGLLTVPAVRQGGAADLWSAVALLVAPAAWAAGSLWMQRRRPDKSVLVISGYQHLFGGIGFVVMALATGEPRPRPIGEAWLAWGYLTLCGSVLAFTSFQQVLRRLPVNVGMTYAYVNPVIAVFLGWLILAERITWWTAAGAVLVVAGVVGIFRERFG